MSKHGAFSNALATTWDLWAARRPGELTLWMPKGACCDMDGAVRVGTFLMPEVTVIRTFSGMRADTMYRKVDDKWEAFTRNGKNKLERASAK